MIAALKFYFAQFRRAESIQRAQRRARKCESIEELATLLWKYSNWCGANSPEVRIICRYIKWYRFHR